MNKNSLLYWWPKIKDLDIPVPKTAITSLEVDAVRQAAFELGYPVFIRTDLCSGKHDWKNSCYVDRESKIEANLEKVIESNLRWRMLGIEPRAVCVREFLCLETAFLAFIGDMPVNKERRYFIENGKVICSHPYWPRTVFNNHPARMVADLDWETKLEAANLWDATEVILQEYAVKVSKVIDGFWSIDFAKSVDGIWYLLDMALGENSYHWPDCRISECKMEVLCPY